MKKIFVLSVFLLFTACKDIKGTLTTNGLSLNEGNIPAGTHEAKIIFSSKKKFKLKVAKEKYTFAIPKGASLPARNGEAFIYSEDNGQPYDVKANVKTTRTRSETFRRWESCTFQQPYTVCTPARGGGQHCSTHYRTVHGHRHAVYHYEIDDKVMVMELSAMEAVQGTFNAREKRRWKVYEYTSTCR